MFDMFKLRALQGSEQRTVRSWAQPGSLRYRPTKIQGQKSGEARKFH